MGQVDDGGNLAADTGVPGAREWHHRLASFPENFLSAIHLVAFFRLRCPAGSIRNSLEIAVIATGRSTVSEQLEE
ncbi:MAG: hypothetical protein QM741_08405 [Rudaea sp.]|uniref:hypothetical protein n=1 Tax=Rudaea sp. TaxID=2136325 RepID=UPI0039E2A758